VCVLTHDPKFDVPLLEVALRRPPPTSARWAAAARTPTGWRGCREAGLTEQELAGLHSPIGLDLGARTAEETAVSIAAEIVQDRWGGSGRPLAETDGRIHEDAAAGPWTHPHDRGRRAAAGRRGRPALRRSQGAGRGRRRAAGARGMRLLRDGGCAPLLVVVGAAADEVRAHSDGAAVVEATDWDTGMAASLRAGLAALPEACDAVVVALVDQPLVTPEAVERLRAAHAAGASPPSRATTAGRATRCCSTGRSWEGGWRPPPRGTRGTGWLRAHPELVVRVDCHRRGARTTSTPRPTCTP
jgi:hypothetical protein